MPILPGSSPAARHTGVASVLMSFSISVSRMADAAPCPSYAPQVIAASPATRTRARSEPPDGAALTGPGRSRLGQPLPPPPARVCWPLGHRARLFLGERRWRGGGRLAARCRRGFRRGFLEHPLGLAGERDALLGFGVRDRCDSGFAFVALLAHERHLGRPLGRRFGALAGKRREAGGFDPGFRRPWLRLRHHLRVAIDELILGDRDNLDRLSGDRCAGRRCGLAPGSRPPAAPTAPPPPPFGLGIAVTLGLGVRRLVGLFAGLRRLARLGTSGRRRDRTGLARLVGPAPPAPTAAAAAFFLALLFRSDFARWGRGLGDLVVLVVVLGQGWRLDRAQRRRLARNIGAQPLQPEVRRDQRVVLVDLDPHAV